MISNIDKFIATPTVILDTINLLSYDNDIDGLHQRLKKSKKDYFGPEEKIIILHNDTEFYYLNNPVGFTLYNFFQCWYTLDIPLSTMVLIANCSDIEQTINDYFVVDEHDCPTVISIVANNASLLHIKSTQHYQTNYTPTHAAVCLMGVARSHRIALMKYLVANQLLQLVRTNFNASSNNYQGSSIVDETLNRAKLSTKSNTVYSHPHRINESCFNMPRHAELGKLLSINEQPYQDPLLSGDFQSFYHKFFLDVVTETVFDYPHVFISEKLLRPLMLKKPFVLFGAPGTLKYLHSYGFKTFNNFWDESYDTEQDPQLRFLKCCSIMQYIVQKPMEELNALHQCLTEILEHNHQVLTKYINDQVTPLYQKIKIYDIN
jgi:hypothetical protein